MGTSIYSNGRQDGRWLMKSGLPVMGAPTVKIFGTNPRSGHLETKAYSGSEADYKIGPHGYAENEYGDVLVPEGHKFIPIKDVQAGKVGPGVAPKGEHNSALGSSGGDGQPRVPPGSPDGGQFAKK